MNEEEEEESEILDEKGIPMENENTTNYIECFKKYRRRDMNWTSDEMKKLLLIFRILCSIILGICLGIIRIPILFSMMIFVFILSVEIPKFISYQLKFNIFSLFDSPVPVMRDNLFFVYVLFTSIWLASDITSHNLFVKKAK